jgi:hypothetical protein
MAAPMRVSFSVDAGRIEWPHAPTADPCDHHLALDVMVDACPTNWISLLGSAAAGQDEPG